MPQKRVLVVEDLDYCMQMLVPGLEQAANKAGLDVSVVLVTNTEEALERLRTERFDLVSLDNTFPATLGGEPERGQGVLVLQQLEKLGHQGGVVFYSGDSEVVKNAARVTIAGRPVLSLEKHAFSLKGNCAPAAAWARMCARLLQPVPQTLAA